MYATAGNTLAWAVETNYTIVSSTATLLGLPPSSVFEDGAQTLYVKVVVPSDPIESYANFTITITNINGTTLTVTEDDLTSGIFNTISPNITLDGSADYYVIRLC